MEREAICWIVASCFSFPFLPETARFVCFIIRSGFYKTRGFRGQFGKISEREEKGSILLEVTMKRNVLRKKGEKWQFWEEGKLEDKPEMIQRNFIFF